MIEIFILQFLAAALGAASTALADRLYERARIRRSVHAFWVSASIALIGLPVVAWTCHVFLGAGLLGLSIAGILAATIFFWVYSSLRKLPPIQNAKPDGRPSDIIPPATRLHG